MLALQVKETN